MHKVRFTPKEGDAVVWDNRRLVHGRTGFRSMTDEERQKSGLKRTQEGEPDRLLKGCYLGVDAVLDRFRALKPRM
jgi:gamma-butyrobetaine dioxygenase